MDEDERAERHTGVDEAERRDRRPLQRIVAQQHRPHHRVTHDDQQHAECAFVEGAAANHIAHDRGRPRQARRRADDALVLEAGEERQDTRHDEESGRRKEQDRRHRPGGQDDPTQEPHHAI